MKNVIDLGRLILLLLTKKGLRLDAEDTIRKEILFSNNNRAQLITPSPSTKITEIVKALEIKKPKALFLISGGASHLDDALKPSLVRLFSRGVAPAAETSEALIIDGGTQAGLMAIIGQAVTDRETKTELIGVAPKGKVTYPGGANEGTIEDGASLDPNHSHFVLVASNEWGGETETMFDIAKELAEGIPVVTILANGGDTAKAEVLRSVRQGWPVIVVEGSGRLADQIAKLWRKKPSSIVDSKIAEIIAEGDIHLLPIDWADSKEKVDQLISSLLNTVLRIAWERFALYDDNAKRQQESFNRLEVGIIALGLFGTILALTQTTLSIQGLGLSWINQALHYAIVVTPITISVLVAAANRFKSGNKWILLRSSAETIKREIFCYRTRSGVYSGQGTATSPEFKLAEKLYKINCHLMKTDVNASALRPYSGSIPPKMYGAAESDNGFSFLTPTQYVSIRLGDQLSYYQGKTIKLERRCKVFYWLIFIFGGLGTLLAAIGLELWIALTIGVVGALTTYMEFKQIDNTLITYNQASTDLYSLKTWWMALSAGEQAEPKNIDLLINYTESILERELAGWVQSMQDSLAELRKEKTEAE